jgi:uncharacterized protein YqgC (DUF456 family)
MTQTELVAALIAFVVMLVGLAGIVVPVLPGTPIIWLAALGYGLVEGFDRWVDFAAMAALSLLTSLSFITDLTLGPAGAARSGASWQAIAASLVGALIGLVFFPPFGALLGALIGVFAVEYQRRNQDTRAAWEATKGFAKGYGLSILINLGLAAMMIGLWVVWVFVERG